MRSDRVRSDQKTGSGQIISVQITPEQIRTEQIKADQIQVRSIQVTSVQFRSSRIRPDQIAERVILNTLDGNAKGAARKMRSAGVHPATNDTYNLVQTKLRTDAADDSLAKRPDLVSKAKTTRPARVATRAVHKAVERLQLGKAPVLVAGGRATYCPCSATQVAWLLWALGLGCWFKGQYTNHALRGGVNCLWCP